MSLSLPDNFNNDIQSRDTNLVPVVVIGTFIGSPTVQNIRDWFGNSIHISTNQVSYYDYRDDTDDDRISVTTKPLLLNIPSLKESIDIEKRNYKISSVSLDISNAIYDSKRFSELVGDSSLINRECRIFWLSPTTTWIYPDDQGYIGDDYGNRAMQIFNGSIRRYTHDDEKVRLVVEDRSQATLHKDLPLTNVGVGVNIPDKYKNKYVPICYGSVDRSPVIPHYSITEEVSTDAGEAINVLEFRLKADTENVDFLSNEEIVTVGSAQHIISSLYFYENDAYHNVHRTNAEIGDGVDEDGDMQGVENFRYGLTDIVLDIDTADYLTEGEALINDFSEGLLRVHAIRRLIK